MSEINITVGPVVLWTETGNACACGQHDTFGKRTLAAIRPIGMAWPEALGQNTYTIIDSRATAEMLATVIDSFDLIPMGRAGAPIRLTWDESAELAAALREQIAPMLMASP